MSMTTRLVMLRDGNTPDHKAKVHAMEACIEANVDPPGVLFDYFGIDEAGEFNADTSGLEVEYGGYGGDGMVTKWKADMQDGFEVDIRRLPPGVVKVRFVNSY